jgi:hypothetical protein
MIADNNSFYYFVLPKQLFDFVRICGKRGVPLKPVAGRIPLILDVHVVFKYLYHCDLARNTFFALQQLNNIYTTNSKRIYVLVRSNQAQGVFRAHPKGQLL